MKHILNVNSNDIQFTIKTEGEASAQGIIALANEIISHPRWKPGNKILFDHRELRLDGIKMDGIEKVAHFFKGVCSKIGNGRVALVMKRDIDFGIARTWEVLTSDDVEFDIEVFRSIDEARKWLVQ